MVKAFLIAALLLSQFTLEPKEPVKKPAPPAPQEKHVPAPSKVEKSQEVITGGNSGAGKSGSAGAGVQPVPGKSSGKTPVEMPGKQSTLPPPDITLQLKPVVPRPKPRDYVYMVPPELIVWSLPGCKPCHDATEDLKAHGVNAVQRYDRPEWCSKMPSPVFHFQCPNGEWKFLDHTAYDGGIVGLLNSIDAKMRANRIKPRILFDDPGHDGYVRVARMRGGK